MQTGGHMQPKERFQEYLQLHYPDRHQELLEQFSAYHALLLAENQKINLFSRQTDPEVLWTWHFLDSLLAAEAYPFEQQRVMDFGTGGGLPGIPLRIVYPKLEMILLDCRQRKAESLQYFIDAMQLSGTSVVWSRLEDLRGPAWEKSLDCIVCRSVRIEPQFRRPLLSLLRPGGDLVFYKAHQMEDLEAFPHKQISSFDFEWLGKRNIVRISKI